MQRSPSANSPKSVTLSKEPNMKYLTGYSNNPSRICSWHNYTVAKGVIDKMERHPATKRIIGTLQNSTTSRVNTTSSPPIPQKYLKHPFTESASPTAVGDPSGPATEGTQAPTLPDLLEYCQYRVLRVWKQRSSSISLHIDG